jgi:hypothetical protein
MAGLGEEVRVIEELGVSQPPDRSKAVQPCSDGLDKENKRTDKRQENKRTTARRARELAVTSKQATYVNYFRTRLLGQEPELHGYLKTGFCVRLLPRKVIQSIIEWLDFG